ncbi:MAG: hypothetical protein HYR86_02215 [Candidatus Rokubacteria bacterium]|nr:hypothetical protein [Candidatus Rokubacteria bacterium]
MDIKKQLIELSAMPASRTPVVSVYLDTHWQDEHQRDRIRAFVVAGLVRAADVEPAPQAEDLRWIEERARAVATQAELGGVRGVGLLACAAVGLREVLSLRVPFTRAFVLAPRPCLRPLVEVLPAAAETLVVWMDVQHARLLPVGPEGLREEVTLTGDVPGHHRRGGWAQLAQSRYRRHIDVHRDRHLNAVADAVGGLVHDLAVERIVLMGETEVLEAFREALGPDVASRVVGTLPGSRHEAAADLANRALALAERAQAAATVALVDEVLVDAAKHTRAVAGLAATLDAIGRGAVHQLYLLREFRQTGTECEHCGLFQAASAPACPHCGQPTTVIELGEGAVRRVLGSGGDVVDVVGHAPLAGHDGMAARLRYTF